MKMSKVNWGPLSGELTWLSLSVTTDQSEKQAHEEDLEPSFKAQLQPGGCVIKVQHFRWKKREKNSAPTLQTWTENNVRFRKHAALYFWNQIVWTVCFWTRRVKKYFGQLR